MKRIDMNLIISGGLVIMGIISIGGWIAFSLKAGTSGGTEIPLAIASGLAGVLSGKSMAENEKIASQPQSQTSKTLGDVAKAASTAQIAVDAIDTLTRITKKGKEQSENK